MNAGALMILEPPGFIGETKKFPEYKKDLKRWSRLTSIKPELQAELIVYRLEGHSSNIKEKIVENFGDNLVDNANGIDDLLNFLETIYGEDDMVDTYMKYVEFKNKKRKKSENIQSFIADWENSYAKCRNAKCDLPDLVLCFELLKASNLDETETQLVLTGVDFQVGTTKKNLLDQVKSSLRKFKGRTAMVNTNTLGSEETSISKEMEVFLVKKGWSKPEKKRKRSNSEPVKGAGYQGRKNKLGKDGLPMKCFQCKCVHTSTSCNCPCNYHFADKCPSGQKTGGAGTSGGTSIHQDVTSAARSELVYM